MHAEMRREFKCTVKFLSSFLRPLDRWILNLQCERALKQLRKLLSNVWLTKGKGLQKHYV